jgi:hypothetical protein
MSVARNVMAGRLLTRTRMIRGTMLMTKPKPEKNPIVTALAVRGKDTEDLLESILTRLTVVVEKNEKRWEANV